MKTLEWLAISVILGFLGMTSVITNFTRVKTNRILSETSLKNTLTIELVGAIEAPGFYQCPMGSALSEVLKSAVPSKKANIGKIPFKKILLSDQRIEIPEKKGKGRGRNKISLEEK